MDKDYFSGGKDGFQVEVAVEDKEKVIKYGTADITV
jgi:Cys-tRNA(Pro)/Cys-tRNA(Cys) deacylase